MAWYEEFFGEDYIRFHLLGAGKYERAQGGSSAFHWRLLARKQAEQ